jgi:ribosomal-protein-alanine N-acetyltransferase
VPDLIDPVDTNVELFGRMQPTIVSDDGTLLLRPWDLADAPQLVQAYRDRLIQRWHLRWFASEAEAVAWVEARGTQWRDHMGGSWAVAETADAAVVLGQVAFRSLHVADGLAELSCWVVRDRRRQQVGSKAIRTLANWALADLRLERVELLHSTRNEPACRTAKRAGFRVEGTKRRLQQYQDGFHDMHLHSRVRGDT